MQPTGGALVLSREHMRVVDNLTVLPVCVMPVPSSLRTAVLMAPCPNILAPVSLPPRYVGRSGPAASEVLLEHMPGQLHCPCCTAFSAPSSARRCTRHSCDCAADSALQQCMCNSTATVAPPALPCPPCMFTAAERIVQQNTCPAAALNGCGGQPTRPLVHMACVACVSAFCSVLGDAP